MNKTAVFGVQEDGQTYINKIGSMLLYMMMRTVELL